MKFIVWCAFVLLVVLALRKKIKLWLRRQHLQNHQHHQKGQQHADTQVEMRAKHPEAMLACAYCGMYIPSSEAVKHSDAEVDANVVFCSVAHRQQYFSVL